MANHALPPLRISALTLHSIAIADPPLRSSYGLHAPWALRTIVEIQTDAGITGFSETYGGEAPRAALEAARDFIIGRDPFQLASLSRLLLSSQSFSLTRTTGEGCVRYKLSLICVKPWAWVYRCIPTVTWE